MKINRLIPCLTISNRKLVKTKNFNLENLNYIGDVLNGIRIFNEKKAQELIILDINATINNTEPNFDLINKISNITRMPLNYGGGIKNLEQAKKILSLGVEKISISSAAFENKNFIKNLSREVGNQSITLVLDIKKINNEYTVFTHNAKKNTGLTLLESYSIFKDYIGELLINNIDNDGMMKGPNYELISNIYPKIEVPLVVMGGFGQLAEIKNIFDKYSIIGVACGSLFIYKGNNKAVLINYPNNEF